MKSFLLRFTLKTFLRWRREKETSLQRESGGSHGRRGTQPRHVAFNRYEMRDRELRRNPRDSARDMCRHKHGHSFCRPRRSSEAELASRRVRHDWRPSACRSEDAALVSRSDSLCMDASKKGACFALGAPRVVSPHRPPRETTHNALSVSQANEKAPASFPSAPTPGESSLLNMPDASSSVPSVLLGKNRML